MSVLTLAAAVLSVFMLGLFFNFLRIVLHSPSELRQRERDFDPDTIQGWNIRNNRSRQ